MRCVFLHGLGQGASSWNNVTSCLPKSINAECPELFAFIDNRATTYTNLYNASSKVFEGTNEPLNLCGLSLGGIVALNYAVNNPSKVRSLALIGARSKIPKTVMKAQNIIFRFLPKSYFKNIGLTREGIIGLTNSMADLDFSKELKNIHCPTIIICGSKDSANLKEARILSENIPKAKLQLVEGAGHMVNESHPRELAGLLKTFYGAF